MNGAETRSNRRDLSPIISCWREHADRVSNIGRDRVKAVAAFGRQLNADYAEYFGPGKEYAGQWTATVEAEGFAPFTIERYRLIAAEIPNIIGNFGNIDDAVAAARTAKAEREAAEKAAEAAEQNRVAEEAEAERQAAEERAESERETAAEREAERLEAEAAAERARLEAEQASETEREQLEREAREAAERFAEAERQEAQARERAERAAQERERREREAEAKARKAEKARKAAEAKARKAGGKTSPGSPPSPPPQALPDGRYGAIYADPPWRFEAWSGAGTDRAAENHYPTMTLEEIEALPVGDMAADDCALFLWATMPHLQEAFRVAT